MFQLLFGFGSIIWFWSMIAWKLCILKVSYDRIYRYYLCTAVCDCAYYYHLVFVTYVHIIHYFNFVFALAYIMDF